MNFQKVKTVTQDRVGASYNEGLRQYMLGVYNLLAIGILITGIASYVTANTPALLNLFYSADESGRLKNTGLGLIVALSPIGILLYMSFAFHKMTESRARTLFFALSAIMGISMSQIFLLYTGQSVAQTFFITSAAFAGLSLYGYTTKKDLSGFATFLVMGLIGLLIAGVVNIFLQSSALHFVYSVAGVLIFAGFTAYDTQNIKDTYFQAGGDKKFAIMGAVKLYLDFINLFMFLLQFLGARRD